jgi:hypothetical protein
MLLTDLLEQLTQIYLKFPNSSVIVDDRDGRESSVDEVYESNNCVYIRIDERISK